MTSHQVTAVCDAGPIVTPDARAARATAARQALDVGHEATSNPTAS